MPTITVVDPGVTVLLGAVGALVAAVLVVRRWPGRSTGDGSGRSTASDTSGGSTGRARRRRGGSERPPGRLPPGAVEVLAALRPTTVVLDGQDRVLRASSAAYALGVVRGETLVAPRIRALVGQVRTDGEVREAVLQIPRGPLAAGSVELAARVARLAGGDLVLVSLEDHTASARVEAVRRDFVANVSHELKTPVGALRLLAEAVSGASDDPEAVRRFAGRMLHEAERLSVLVQDIIDLSRLQGQDALREPHLVRLDHVVTEAIDRVRMAAAARDIRVVTAGHTGVTVLGDESLLVTALRNLVDNAINYSAHHTQVTVGVRRAAEVVEISVTDQGIGIPDQDLERIFERFYRVDHARSRATGGTGLGLSIVKHLMGAMEGDVKVESQPNVGSVFAIFLPVDTAETASR